MRDTDAAKEKNDSVYAFENANDRKVCRYNT
jgi:hypothetical protein